MIYRPNATINPFEFVCDRTLTGLMVNVSVFAANPYSTYIDSTEQFKGSDIDLIQTVSKKLNFDITMTRRHSFSFDPDTGEWSGVVGDVRIVQYCKYVF